MVVWASDKELKVFTLCFNQGGVQMLVCSSNCSLSLIHIRDPSSFVCDLQNVLVTRLHVNATLKRAVFVNVVMERMWVSELLLQAIIICSCMSCHSFVWPCFMHFNEKTVISHSSTGSCKAFTRAAGFTERRFAQRACMWFKCAVHFMTINKSYLETVSYWPSMSRRSTGVRNIKQVIPLMHYVFITFYYTA